MDLRNGYDGLFGLVNQGLGRDPLSADLFLFVNARRKGYKVVVWDGTGLCIFQKRLERSSFAALWRDDGDVVTLTGSELALFIEGCALVGRRALSPAVVVATALVIHDDRAGPRRIDGAVSVLHEPSHAARCVGKAARRKPVAITRRTEGEERAAQRAGSKPEIEHVLACADLLSRSSSRARLHLSMRPRSTWKAGSWRSRPSSYRRLDVVSGTPRARKFPAAEPLAADHTDRSGQSH